MKDRADEAWDSFIERFQKIPKTYQLKILDEYEAACREKRDLDVEKMWKILILGENPELMFELLKADAEKNRPSS